MIPWQQLTNPYPDAFKKLIIELLGDKHQKFLSSIETLSKLVQNEKDFKQMGDMLAAIFSNGYMKSVDQHKELLAKMGFEVKVKKQETPKTIF